MLMAISGRRQLNQLHASDTVDGGEGYITGSYIVYYTPQTLEVSRKIHANRKDRITTAVLVVLVVPQYVQVAHAHARARGRPQIPVGVGIVALHHRIHFRRRRAAMRGANG